MLINKKFIAPIVLGIVATCAGITTSPVGAEVHEVTIENDQFSPAQLDVAVGDTLQFHNLDVQAHSPFSLSDTQMFDLGEMKTGDQKSVEMKREGSLEVTCGIYGGSVLSVLVHQERPKVEPREDSFDIGNDSQPKIFGPEGLMPATDAVSEPSLEESEAP